MKISYKCDYALKTILDLALNYGMGMVTIPDLASRLDIPRKFLEQVLLVLKKGEFVDSKRGPEGGYFLAKPPSVITVGAVVRFVEGPIEPIACVNDCYKDCAELHDCVFRGVWIKTARAISSIVDNITIEDLLNELKKKREILNYSI